MVKEWEVLPDFTPGAITFGEIPTFRYGGRLQDEIGRRLDPARAVDIFEQMLTIRAFEEMIVALKEGKYEPLPGFKFVGATHLSIGQEGVAAGAINAIRPDDYITSTHRGHGHSIAKGWTAVKAMEEARRAAFVKGYEDGAGEGDLRERALQVHLNRTMAELFGKEAGYCRGRGGGMHIADFNAGHLGANAIVGGSYAIATGAALGSIKLGLGRVALGIVGDGAENNGIAHECKNFATMGQWPRGLPLIFLIENNQYGMTGQQLREVTGVRYLAQRAAGYDDQAMHAEVVNGMDALAVWDAVTRAAEIARRGDGAVVLECMTYRYMGHSLSDSRVRYRSQEEEEAWKACDAICRMKEQLIEAKVVSEPQIAALEEQAQARIRRACDWAAHAADPDPKEMYAGLFTDTTSDGIGDEYRTTQIHKRVRRFKRDSDGAILYRHAVWEALFEEMMRDRRVVLYGEDVADYGGAFQVTVGLIDAFGRDRVFNTAISEAAVCGTAAGAAMVGMRPVAEIMYIDFVPLALDQIGNQIAKTRYMFGGKATLPLVIRTTLGGGKGYAGQHSQSLEAVVTQFPGLKVVAPSTAYDVKGLLKSAIRDDNPVIFIEHQLLYTEKGVVPEEEYLVPLGVANVLREGMDLTLVAYSRQALVAMEAAERGAQEGISIEVVDPRTLLPLDVETISKSVAKTGRLLLACQAPKTGCFAEHIAYEVQACCFQHLKAPVKIVAAYDVPPPMAQPLEQENIPDAAKLLREAKTML